MKIINKSQNILPECHAKHSEGMNVRDSKSVDIVLKPGKRAQAKEDLYMDISVGFVAKRKTRRGPAINHRITVIDEGRTIDTDYTGEVSITRINLSDKDFVINDRERICQMIITKHRRTERFVIDELISTCKGLEGLVNTGRH